MTKIDPDHAADIGKASDEYSALINQQPNHPTQTVSSSRLGLFDAVPLLGIVAGCYWLAFSSKSPVAGKFFARMFFFLFAPAICVTLFLAMKKML